MILQAALALLLTLARDAGADEPAAAVDNFEESVSAWDLPAARRALGGAPAGARRTAREGILALYEGSYPEAERLLTQALASGSLAEGSAEAIEAQHYLALARGSQRALGRPLIQSNPGGEVTIAFADPRDALLAPYLFDAMDAARARLGAELGVIPDHAVRIEILDDPAKLALVTPLTLDNIYATGTIGITKYRRIVMVSPRVLLYGYPWLDTVVHEYVHYLLTIRTRNRAPVWLQEGLAKLFEARWRSDTAPPLSAADQRLLQRALVQDDLVTLAEMSPSVAMLPSQERAALAYAEVETMLGYLRERRGEPGINLILDAVRDGVDAEDALAGAWGAPFAEFMGAWAAEMKRRTAGAGKSDAKLKERRFRDADDAGSTVDPALLGDVFSHLGGGAASQHARLGVLLTLRGHRKAAAEQYEKARRVDAVSRRDPKLARRLGELYLELDEPAKALPLLEIAAADDPEQPNIAAAEGRARLRVGDREGARSALARALRVNPFIPSVHCDLATLAEREDEATRERSLCRE
ncbi:MAG: hypothetical protein R3B09_33260 [Nannocystaceae bacterium]